MTTPTHPVVEALERAERFIDSAKGLRGVEKKTAVEDYLAPLRKALPLARHNAEAEAALRWIITKYYNTCVDCYIFADPELPAIIKKMLEEGK